MQDDETTLSEEEELAKADSNNYIDEVRKCPGPPGHLVLFTVILLTLQHFRSLSFYMYTDM